MKNRISYVFLIGFSFLSSLFSCVDLNIDNKKEPEHLTSEFFMKLECGKVTRSDMVLCYEVTNHFINLLKGVIFKDGQELNNNILNIDNYIMVPATGKVVDKFNNLISNAMVSNVEPFCHSLFMEKLLFDDHRAVSKYVKSGEESDSDIINFYVSENGLFGRGNFSFEFQRDVLYSAIGFALKKCIISNWITIYNLSREILIKLKKIDVKEDNIDAFLDDTSLVCDDFIKSVYSQNGNFILSKFSGNVRNFIPYSKDLARIINSL